jgi:hypothetical protein
MEADIAGRGLTFDDVQLHLTINELEITGQLPIYCDLGISSPA